METTAYSPQLTNACSQIWTSHKRRTKRPAWPGQSERRARPPARNHLSDWLSRNDLVFGGNFSGVLWCLRRCAVDVTRYFIEARLFEFLCLVVIIIRLCMEIYIMESPWFLDDFLSRWYCYKYITLILNIDLMKHQIVIIKHIFDTASSSSLEDTYFYKIIIIYIFFYVK